VPLCHCATEVITAALDMLLQGVCGLASIFTFTLPWFLRVCQMYWFHQIYITAESQFT